MADIVLFQDQVVSPFGFLRHLALCRRGSLSLLETLFYLNPKASLAIVPFSKEKKQQLLSRLAYLEFPTLLKGSVNADVNGNVNDAGSNFFSNTSSSKSSSKKKTNKDTPFIFINARHINDVALLEKTISQTQSLSVGEGFREKSGWISGKLSWGKIGKDQVCASDFFSLLKPISIDSRLIEHSFQCLNDLKSKMILQNKLRIKKGDLVEKQKGVWCPPNFKGLHKKAVICGASKNVPIVLERGVEISPYVVLEAPIYLAEFSLVKPHAQISCSAIGRKSKVGGEVHSSVIDDFSNKAHGGFLGHSLLGCWVNVGAGSEFSNLKNTYGPVRFDVGGRNERVTTDMIFLGSLVGDFAKISINTSVLSGKAIGTAAMASGLVDRGLPNFHWKNGELVDLFSLLETQKRMFLRRNIEQTDWHRELLSLVYKS